MKPQRTGSFPKTGRQRGSALLVSLMVMVGLSLLGLGFVAISETESAISVNERNYAESLSVAESGARAVVEMFQDADWASGIGILPPNNTAIKTLRTVGTYSGYYKQNPSTKLFDSPFKQVQGDRFYGNEENADVVISAAQGQVAIDYLDDLNEALFGDDANPRIVEIRAYAPPIVGGTLVGGFWTQGDRFGVATVKVTAVKSGPNGQPIARRAVKIIVGETPLPGATGPIQTEGALDNSGSFEVYWGKVTAVDDLKLIKPAVSLPWFDAKNQAFFEFGYDSTRPFIAGKNYATVGEVVHAPKAARDAIPTLRQFAYEVVTAGIAAAVEPPAAAWPQVLEQTYDSGSVKFKTVHARQFPIEPTAYGEGDEWLWELLGKAIQDPWFQARTRGNLCYNNNCTATPNLPHPFKYNNPSLDEENLYSNFFKFQTYTENTDPTDRIEVTFPTIDYEFWKEIAQSSEPDSGIIYLQWVPAKQVFRSMDNVEKTAAQWLNAIDNGYGAGFYFFDSANGINPQYGAGGTLTPEITIGASDKGPSGFFQMQGFIYLNAAFFGTVGVGNPPEDVYPMPGEPFRDVGYRKVDKTSMDYEKDASGDFVLVGRNDNEFSFQDLNENLTFDVVTVEKLIKRPGDNSVITAWLPKIYYEGCSVGVDCSEPHEPYLNYVYPTLDNAEGSITIGWYAKNDLAPMRPKVRIDSNTANSCSATSKPWECTGNWHDDVGAVVRIDPVLNGILYNEGGYNAQGNAKYYGSLLIRGEFKGNGTPAVYFNECILKNCWQEQLNLPKVMIQATQTDQ